MVFRAAGLSDIKQIQEVRLRVKENRLSNPDLIPDQDVAFHLSQKGKGWVCEVDGRVVGFSIIDLQEKRVWALFVDPDFAEKGIGRALHKLMIDWYFVQTHEKVELGTAPNTRAERFYPLQGWTRKGTYPNGEVKFELTYEAWSHRV